MLYAHRGHVTGALAVFDQLLAAHDHRRSVFAARGRRMVVCLRLERCDVSQRQSTGERGAAFEEVPAVSSFRIHRRLLRTHRSLVRKMTRRRNHVPGGRKYTRPCPIWPVLSRGLRILKRQPGPVINKFELLIDLKTAKALGLYPTRCSPAPTRSSNRASLVHCICRLLAQRWGKSEH